MKYIVYLALCCYSKNSVPYFLSSIRSIANPIIIQKIPKILIEIIYFLWEIPYKEW